MDRINEYKAAFAAFLGLLTGFWGWLGWLVVLWIGMMVLDYLTGSAAAAKDGKWSSAKAREGIWHKMGMVVIVVVAAVADMLIRMVLDYIPAIQLPFHYCCVLAPIVLVWYIVTELGSIAENAAVMGAPVPKWLLKLLETVNETIDKAGDGLSNNNKEE